MACIYFTTDLMMQSHVTSSGQRVGCKVAALPNADAFAKRAAEGDVQLALLDLTAPGCDAALLVAAVKQANPEAVVIAYAPHVREALLEEARQAGCDTVLSRGAFNSQIGQLLSEYAAADGAG